MTDPILALETDIFGVLWGATECSLHYLMPAKGSLWKSLDFCSTFQEETPLELHIEGRNIFLATEDHGIRVIEYNVSSEDSTSIVIERNVVWDDSNLLSGNSISDIAISEDILYIATTDSGIARFDISSESWIPSWTSSNWLSSDVTMGLAVTPGWLHIL